MKISPDVDPKSSDEALRKYAERLALTLDATNQGVWDWDMTGEDIIFTPICYTLLGYEPYAFPQTLSTWRAMLHPEDQARFDDALDRHIEKGDEFAVELRFKTQSGDWGWIINRGRVVERDGAGKALRMVGSFTDIDQRKHVEARLQKEMERGKRLLELYELAPMLSDQELYSYILDQAVALTDSTIGFFHLVSKDQAFIDLTTWNQIAQENCMAPGETHYAIGQAGNWVDCVRTKRTVIYNEFPASPNQKGLPVGHTPVKRFMSIPVLEDGLVRIIFGVGNKARAYDEQDAVQIQLIANELQKILRQRQVDEALRENERLLSDVQEIAHLGSWVHNLVTGELQWSDETYRIFQIPIGTPISFPGFLQYLHPDDVSMIQRTHQHVLAGNAPPDIEFRIHCPNGEERHVFRRGQLEFDADGRAVRLKGSIQDITERKRAEEEIRSLNLELERRVRERTAQLETAIRELEGFAYTISHDLRAPLRHIHGFVQLLSEETTFNANDNTREYMKTIALSAKQMGSLIDDLLTFTHLGRKELIMTRLDLNQLISEAMRELQPETTGRSIRWLIAELPEVFGDQDMLYLVISNLIANAIKFTRLRPQAQIEIGFGQELPGERFFFVRDNGVGFDMKYAGKLFGVFQRLHRTTEFEGNGIGLANVQRIIQRHGGRIWAESQVDQGATFTFTLPI